MKKLLTFILFVVAADRSASQIVYTDVLPDSTVSATQAQVIKSYYIDLDNDGTYEMELRHFNPDPNNIAVELHRNPHSSAEPQVLTHASGHARVFGNGIVISSSSSYWGQDQYGILDAPWYGGGDKYFGFRFKRRGEWHYGWARVSMPADASSFTIKDYAYEEMVNAPITTGSGSTGIETTAAAGVSVYINTAEHQLVLTYPGRDVREITLLDMLGRNVQHVAAGATATRIDTHGLARGTYVVALSTGRAAGQFLVIRL